MANACPRICAHSVMPMSIGTSVPTTARTNVLPTTASFSSHASASVFAGPASRESTENAWLTPCAPHATSTKNGTPKMTAFAKPTSGGSTESAFPMTSVPFVMPMKNGTTFRAVFVRADISGSRKLFRVLPGVRSCVRRLQNPE